MGKTVFELVKAKRRIKELEKRLTPPKPSSVGCPSIGAPEAAVSTYKLFPILFRPAGLMTSAVMSSARGENAPPSAIDLVDEIVAQAA